MPCVLTMLEILSAPLQDASWGSDTTLCRAPTCEKLSALRLLSGKVKSFIHNIIKDIEQWGQGGSQETVKSIAADMRIYYAVHNIENSISQEPEAAILGKTCWLQIRLQ